MPKISEISESESSIKEPISQNMLRVSYQTTYGAVTYVPLSFDATSKGWRTMPDDILMTTAQYCLKEPPPRQLMEVEKEQFLLDSLNNRANLDIDYYPEPRCGKYGCMPIDYVWEPDNDCEGCPCKYGNQFKCRYDANHPGSLRNECYACYNFCTDIFCCTPAVLIMCVLTPIASCAGYVYDCGLKIRHGYNKFYREDKIHSFFGSKPAEIVYNHLDETQHLLAPPP